MEKTAKITRVNFINEWAGANGVVYYHEIQLDNNDIGQIGTKEKLPGKLAVGQELTYTIESTPRGNKIKAVAAASGFKTGGKPMQDPRAQFLTMGYSYSKDLVVAGKLSLNDFHTCAKDIFDNMVKNYNK